MTVTIGEKIRELRKKCDMTQEKLADFLGVSYQAVSKWECGLTSPDLGLIGPITKLFGVSADELLGLTKEENDERKAYFDSEYKGYWKRTDLKAGYETAKQAVEEYPGNMVYLNWLANMEYYLAFDEDYLKGIPYERLDNFKSMMEKAIRHALTVYENAADEELRSSSLWTLILAHKYTNRPDEARRYAELYPEKASTTRDDAMLLVLTGEERIRLRQKMLIDVFCRLNVLLDEFDDDERLIEEAERLNESIIRALIPDGNYLRFASDLFFIRLGRAKRAARDNKKGDAQRLLKEALDYGREYDRAVQDGTKKYTSPLLEGYVFFDPEYDSRNFTCTGELRDQLRSEEAFAPFRDDPEFTAIIDT